MKGFYSDPLVEQMDSTTLSWSGSIKLSSCQDKISSYEASIPMFTSLSTASILDSDVLQWLTRTVQGMNDDLHHFTTHCALRFSN